MRRIAHMLGMISILAVPTVGMHAAAGHWGKSPAQHDATTLTAHVFQHGKETHQIVRFQLSAMQFRNRRLSFDVAFPGGRRSYVGQAERDNFTHQISVVFHNLSGYRRPSRFIVSFVRIDNTPGMRPDIVGRFPARDGPLLRVDLFDRARTEFYVAEVPIRTLPRPVAQLLRSILRLRPSLPLADAATNNGALLPITVGAHPQP